ncbi:MAG: trigger factor [Faecalibacterium sp.]|nr:trigger factor [Faecalibacterium sp.]
MKLVKIEYPENGVCLLTLSATAEELEAGAQAVYERVRSEYTIKGFAKGEADRAQIEADRGEHAFWYEAINDVMDRDVPAILDEVVAAEKLSVEGEPSYDLISVKKDEGFVATAQIALTPVLTLTKYTGFTAQCTPAPTTDKEVENTIESRRQLHSELVPHKGPAVKGNTVKLSYTGYVDGEEFAGGKAENQSIELGRGRMIPGFEEAILGHKAGESFDINVTFPANYFNKELAGKPAVFKATLGDVCLRQIPVLGPELAKKLDASCETMDDYRALVRKQLEENKHNVAMSRARNVIMTQLADSMEGEISSVLIEREFANQMQQFQASLQMQRMTMDGFLKQTGRTREDVQDTLHRTADRTIRLGHALLAVAKAENLILDDEGLHAELALRAERVSKPVDEYIKTVNGEELRSTLARKAAMDFVIAHSTIEE